MTNQSNYKTLSDGSINHAYYIAQSHVIRSDQAHHFMRTIWRKLKVWVLANTGRGNAENASVITDRYIA